MSGWLYLARLSRFESHFSSATAWKLKYRPEKLTAWKMFKFSIWHLMLLYLFYYWPITTCS